MDGIGSLGATRPRRISVRRSVQCPARGHRASTPVRPAALLLTAAAVLAGCTAAGSGVQAQDLTPVSSASSATSSSNLDSPSSSEPQSSPAAPPSSAAPVTAVSTPTTTADPWPADLTPEQQDQARAALAALDGYIQVTNAASADPAAKDWTADVRKYTADPAATQFLESLRSFVAAGVHQANPPNYQSPTVVSILGNKVAIEACVDRSGQSIVDADGQSALDPVPDPRSRWTAYVYLYDPPNGWLVSETVPSKPVIPC